MEDLNTKIDILIKKVDDLEKSFGKKYEEIKLNIRTTIENQELLNQSLRKMQKENKAYRVEVAELKDRIESLERANLDATLNLYPVVEAKDMDLDVLIKKIGGKIGMKIEDKDIIDKFRRRQRKNGKPGDIVIKCANKGIRDKLIIGIKKHKLSNEDIGYKCELKRIYANEELTRNGKDIYYKALKVKYEKKFKFLWVKGGMTYIKKDETSRAIRLDNMDILNELC